MKRFPLLYTDRCTLRAVTQEDIPIMFEILNDAETQRFLPELCSFLKTEESILKFISTFNNYIFQDNGIIWGVRKGDNFIGFIAIIDISDCPTIFYAIHPEYRRMGYAKEAVAEVVAYCKSISRNPLHTEVFLANHASLSVLTYCGFHVMGRKDNKFMLTLQNYASCITTLK